MNFAHQVARPVQSPCSMEFILSVVILFLLQVSQFIGKDLSKQDTILYYVFDDLSTTMLIVKVCIRILLQWSTTHSTNFKGSSPDSRLSAWGLHCSETFPVRWLPLCRSSVRERSLTELDAQPWSDVKKGSCWWPQTRPLWTVNGYRDNDVQVGWATCIESIIEHSLNQMHQRTGNQCSLSHLGETC
jgi:hypothetical protein